LAELPLALLVLMALLVLLVGLHKLAWLAEAGW
jgi:hypothetical protein